MKNLPVKYTGYVILLALSCCHMRRDQEEFQRDLQSINLLRGDIALCGSEEGQFGKVTFALSCVERVRADFNLATALLHSFEYSEAEKVFAKVIDEDPDCLMAYWGVAMSNFHPLWEPPTKAELEKGSRTITLARKLKRKSERESDYLQAASVLYEDWDKLDHRTRVLKFEKEAEKIYKKYRTDKEAAIFYALALRAAADPADKSFARQRKAGDILNALFDSEPNHPGIAHYLIHSYDYPELAQLGLPAARKYAAVAATSAHALHMPSHIFIRLGLWDESIQSNLSSVSAAKCYAENSGMQGHWDEELHGIDYLVYAYLQQGRDEQAKEQLDYLASIDVVFPINGKDAYSFAAAPTRFALERKDWEQASRLELKENFPWEKFPWERAIVSFGRILGAAHLNKPEDIKRALSELEKSYNDLMKANKTYEANQVQIQIKASEAWKHFSEGKRDEAVRSMMVAALMEDGTEKHPVTPGEVVPARELLGDMYMEMKEFSKALEAYEADLEKHPGRFNALYGAARAANESGDKEKAIRFFRELVSNAQLAQKKRREVRSAEFFLEEHI